MLIAINPARTGSIKLNAVPPIPLNKAAACVSVPKLLFTASAEPYWSIKACGILFKSTISPSIKNAIAIKIPPPTTNGSIWDTPFIKCL